MSRLTPVPILPQPGVVLTESRRVVEGRWIDAKNIRFVKGLPQKLGGNERAVDTPTEGSPRAIHAWRDNLQNNYLAVGTYKKLYVYDTIFAQNDITPYRSTGTLEEDPFTTTEGSNIVLVDHEFHGLAPGDTIHLSGAEDVGGLDLNGAFIVQMSVNSGQYTFAANGEASSSGTGGGDSVGFSYEVPIGVEVGIYGYGYGAGGYGLGSYGTPRTQSTIFIEPRVWSLDHFGKLLIASYNGGSIYEFDPTVSQPWGRATLISSDPGLPDNCRFAFVTPERFIMALLDNMQVAWCSQGDRSTWTPAVGNTANVRTLTEGTKLVAGRVLSDFISLVWSDGALYRFQYTGSTYVYNSSMVAKDCGLISPGAVVTASGVAYWMGQDTFWMYNGSVMPIPNVEDIRKFLFSHLKVDYSYQCTAVYMPQHNEVAFFYTVEGENNPTFGVLYSIENQCWSPLDFGRCSGTHFTQGDTRPYMGHSDGYIYQHEIGHDDNGSPMPWSLTLSPYAITEGMASMDVEYLVPDFFEQIGNIHLTVTGWDRLNDSEPQDSDTGTIEAVDSGPIDLRVSGRYVGLMLGCEGLGCYFRWGKPVAFIRSTGRRS